jgi:hypothetical protein
MMVLQEPLRSRSLTVLCKAVEQCGDAGLDGGPSTPVLVQGDLLTAQSTTQLVRVLERPGAAEVAYMMPCPT